MPGFLKASIFVGPMGVKSFLKAPGRPSMSPECCALALSACSTALRL